MKTKIIALLCLCGLTAAAQSSFTSFISWTNFPTYVLTGGSSNVATWSGTTNTIRPGWGISVSMKIGGTNVGGIIYGAISIDGTNWSSNPMPLYFTNPASDAYVFTTNIPAAVLDGFRVFRFASVTNQSATPLYITNLMAGRGIR